MMYFTVSKVDNNYILDSFSKNFEALKTKFPKEAIYESDKPLKSIYITKQQLNRVYG